MGPTSPPTPPPTPPPTAAPTAPPTKEPIMVASITMLVAPDQPSIQTTDDLNDALVSTSNDALARRIRSRLSRSLVTSGCDVQASSNEIDCSTDDFTQAQIDDANFCADSTIVVSFDETSNGICDVADAVDIISNDINDPNGSIASGIGPTTGAVVIEGTLQPSSKPSESPTDASSGEPTESPTESTPTESPTDSPTESPPHVDTASPTVSATKS